MKLYNGAKILLFDIETKPVKFWGWGVGKQYVTHDRIVAGEKFDIICIAYKWLGQGPVKVLDWGLKEQCSKKMIDLFTKEVEQADLVVGHNGDKFDIRQINTQRMMHNQPPIAWPTAEDTLKQLRAKFYFPSFKLDYITKTLFGVGKSSMCMEDWIAIVDRKCAKSLKKMKDYNVKDVLLLEKTFVKIAPYVKPKINKTYGSVACVRCGDSDVKKNGHRYTLTGKKQVLRCLSCYTVFTLTSIKTEAQPCQKSKRGK
jgi:hypothetical protein